LAGLEGARGPVLICTQLANNGYDSATIDRYIDIVQTVEDNAALPIGSPLSPRLSAVERSCDVLVWAVPVACLAIGLLGIRAKHRNAWVAGVRRVEPRAGRPVRASWARLTAT
jgi:hypothetical protein